MFLALSEPNLNATVYFNDAIKWYYSEYLPATLQAGEEATFNWASNVPMAAAEHLALSASFNVLFLHARKDTGETRGRRTVPTLLLVVVAVVSGAAVLHRGSSPLMRTSTNSPSHSPCLSSMCLEL